MSQPPLDQNLFAPAENEPCLRIPFKLMLSSNDLKGEKWQVASQRETWRQRGCDRAIATLKKRGDVDIEAYAEQKVKQYRGKKYIELVTGERCKTPFFREPVILIARFWKSDESAYDIDNLYLKACIDGFVDARLLVNDTTDYLPTVVRHYEGVDRTLALSASDSAERKSIRQQWQRANLKKQLPPPANKRIWLDFWRKSVLLKNNPYFLLTRLTDV